jgi:hypothetical protein
MATAQEKQDLVDDIKKPHRHYRITLVGYGGEIIYGKSSKEEYDYWETSIGERRKEFNVPEDESPFNRYMIDKDDIGGYENVPKSIVRIGEWWDSNDIDHGSGVSYDSAVIAIVECETDEIFSVECNSIIELPLTEFINQYDAESVIGDSEAVDGGYMYYAMDVQKGLFFDGRLTTIGKIDLSKLAFECTEYPNGDTLVNHVFYGEEELYDDGGDTNEKALYIELVAA